MLRDKDLLHGGGVVEMDSLYTIWQVTVGVAPQQFEDYFDVIFAEAGIQTSQNSLDSGSR